jgi:hypothetical protein
MDAAVWFEILLHCELEQVFSVRRVCHQARAASEVLRQLLLSREAPVSLTPTFEQRAWGIFLAGPNSSDKRHLARTAARVLSNLPHQITVRSALFERKAQSEYYSSFTAEAIWTVDGREVQQKSRGDVQYNFYDDLEDDRTFVTKVPIFCCRMAPK